MRLIELKEWLESQPQDNDLAAIHDTNESLTERDKFSDSVYVGREFGLEDGNVTIEIAKDFIDRILSIRAQSRPNLLSICLIKATVKQQTTG